MTTAARQAAGKRGQVSRRVRLIDVAARCGVSVATVSRALGSGRGVAPDLRARVLEVAQRLGYVLPSSVAGKTVILAASQAAMIDYARSQFTLHVLDGLTERAAALGLDVRTRAVADPSDEAALWAEVRGDAATAGVLYLTPDDGDVAGRAGDLGKPLVLVNGEDPGMRLSSVAPCNRSAAALATGALVAAGHRDILFLTRPGRRTIARRLEGWRDRMAEAGLPAGPDRVIAVADWLPDLARAAVAGHLARRGRDFTAILAAGDSLALGALMALAEAGVAVPAQVSVLGIDGLPQAALTTPPLSVVEIPMRAIGAAALDLLREELAAPGALPKRVELACRLVPRGSTGPAPGTGTGPGPVPA